jgi:hypothetical protein
MVFEQAVSQATPLSDEMTKQKSELENQRLQYD